MLTSIRYSNSGKDDGKRTFAPKWESENLEEFNFVCPLCEEDVVFVSEGSDGTIAHFRHKMEPAHPKISEGRTHQRAKMKFYNQLKGDKNDDGVYTDWISKISKVQLEKVIYSDADSSSVEEIFDRGYEIADLYFEYGDEKCVVEFQCSSQGWRQFKLRTMFYNLHGYKVLWILDKDLFSQDKQGRYICKSAFYNLSKMYDGRLYVFDFDRDEIFAGKFVNFSAKTRASKFAVNQVSELTSFKFDVGGLGDIFRFDDGLSYSDLNDGSDLEEWGSTYSGAEDDEKFVCPVCTKKYEVESYYKKHVEGCLP